jgi:hypothetical protein
MRFLFVAFLVLHGLIHLMGFAKAYGFAELPQLRLPISPPVGVAWLVAAVLFVAAGVCVYAVPRWWWAVGACALVVSTPVIWFSWADAKVGAVANVVVLVAVVVGAAMSGPTSLRAQYDRDVAGAAAMRIQALPMVTEADLAPLPLPVQRYLRLAGVVGHERVSNFRARMHGRIRSGPDATWMPLQAEQHNFIDDASRHFYMTASMFLVPIDGYHRFVGQDATMLIKAMGMVPVASNAGPEMAQAETVTVFNDMCVMAPATLIDPAIAWETLDAHTVRATFTRGANVARADLVFNDQGELVNFWSDDRRQAPPDGGAMAPVRWSTPLRGYRSHGPFRLMGRGEGRWHEPQGDYAYIELELDDIAYNVMP